MDRLLEAIIELVANSPPDKAEQLARVDSAAFRRRRSSDRLQGWAANPGARDRLAKLIRGVAKTASIPPAELAGMLTAASAAYTKQKPNKKSSSSGPGLPAS